MKFKINLSKIFLDIYPNDMVKQFKKVSLPFYFAFSLLMFYIVVNIQPLFFSKTVKFETIIDFYFVLPVVYPLLLLGLLFSSISILRHNNPIYLFYGSFKHLLLYGLNIGMIFLCLFFLLIYGFFISQVSSLV